MAANPSNTPAGTATNLAAGNAVAYLGAEATTPTADVGFLEEEGISLTYEAEILDGTAGFPATSVRQFIQAVTAGFSFVSREWNLAQFGDAVTSAYSTVDLGGGQIAEILGVGTDPCPAEKTAKVEFCIPCTSDTIEINIWRIQSNGSFEWTFDPTAFHNWTYDWKILAATQKWDATALVAATSLFEITRTPPIP